MAYFCGENQYFDYGFLKCKDCHYSCDGCTSTLIFDCIECATDYFWVNGSCKSCEEFTGYKTPLDFDGKNCEEICGDL